MEEKKEEEEAVVEVVKAPVKEIEGIGMLL